MKKHAPAIRVIIVDDENKACINLKHFLNEYAVGDVSIAGVANNTKEAEQLIADVHPDAVFIDIDMPKENAFQFLQRITPFSFEVVFVTAYDQYAIKALRLNAVDYILKPIDVDELISAVAKLKERIHFNRIIKGGSLSYADLNKQVQKKAESHKIRLKSLHYSELVDFSDIYFIEAQGSYSRIVFLKEQNVGEMLMSNPLSDYEELLPAHMFYRVHKTYLINCMHISKFITDDSSYVVLKNQFTIPVSRRRIIAMKKFLKSNSYFL